MKEQYGQWRGWKKHLMVFQPGSHPVSSVKDARNPGNAHAGWCWSLWEAGKPPTVGAALHPNWTYVENDFLGVASQLDYALRTYFQALYVKKGSVCFKLVC